MGDKMSSIAQQVMGHAFRPKVSQFNSSAQSFSKYQNELQNSFVTAHPNPMHPESIKRFAALLESMDRLQVKIGKNRKTASAETNSLVVITSK